MLQDRRGGAYFAEMLTAAAESGPSMVGVTSFNEWHEGTQIEPAAPRPGYPDYAPLPPEGYLALLARHAATLK
jgi:glycoprotein endo-alpha-1,2-mannosidase